MDGLQAEVKRRAAPGSLKRAGTGARGKRKVVLGDKATLTQLDLQEKVAVEELGIGQALTDEGKQEEKQ